MKNSILKITIILLSSILLFSFGLTDVWFSAGSLGKSYKMGIDKGAGQNGGNAATIKSIDAKIKGFGTFMQQSKPNKYLGKRIKMTGFVKSENVTNWAGLWLRVDQLGSGKSVSFDNMNDRPIKGTTEWTKYEIILDVPSDASLLAFGALLSGTGQVWFDNLKFEIVSDIKTESDKTSKTQEKPINLDFEN
jgi:hypothetical protein